MQSHDQDEKRSEEMHRMDAHCAHRITRGTFVHQESFLPPMVPILSFDLQMADAATNAAMHLYPALKTDGPCGLGCDSHVW